MSALIDIQRTRSPKPRPAASELGFGRHFTDHMFLMEFERGRGWGGARVVPYGPIQVEPAASALHYGQTIFEGLKAFPDPGGRIRVFRLADHLARFNQSARTLCIPEVDTELTARGIRTLLALDAPWMPEGEGTSLYIRPLIFATEPFLGVRPAEHFLMCVFLSPVAGYYSTGAAPVRIWVEEKYTRAAPGGLGTAKTGANYAASLRAAEESRGRGFDQVLWLDAREHKHVEEVGTMNLFLRIGDEIVTPPLEGTLLAGITRDSVITLLRQWGIKVTERRVSIEEIRTAHARGGLQEIFGSGTAAVISPVGELGFANASIKIGDSAGPIATRLKKAITDIQYGRAPDLFGWLSPVDALAEAEDRAGVAVRA
ncbi:MAG TPA: branched-chain amino acid aminotransferase [Myxococcaceae bacterium]|nr:branched-chain amino acid aminotransferase [Myxococcaceae bacterium]